MFEFEKTYLAKYLPKDLTNFPHAEIVDIYYPKTAKHPVLRLRRIGEKIELTKKQPVNGGDSSHQEEQTIALSAEEFQELARLEGKRLRKIRYYYPYQGKTAEVDVYQDGLAGLVAVDVEFESYDEMEGFEMPEFCLYEVTQEKLIAAGMLAGKSYIDIQKGLEQFGYIKITLEEGEQR